MFNEAPIIRLTLHLHLRTLNYKLGQNKMKNKTPLPPPLPPHVNDEFTRKANQNALFFFIIDMVGGGGSNVSFVLTEIVGAGKHSYLFSTKV